MKDAVEELVQTLEPNLDIPFALFGHSMGAVISFELARTLVARQKRPLHLIVSGRRAPQCPDRRASMAALSDDEFVAEIGRRYNGIPREVLEHRELLELLLPTLRADVALLETHDYKPSTPFDFPITAFGGLNDTETSLEELAGWKHQTSAEFTQKLFSGDHFFVQSNATEVVNDIRTILERPS